MDLVDIEKFREWLRKNTKLSEGSILLYARTVNCFLDAYEELTLENLNDFVSKSFRERNSSYMKYAFRYYLKYVQRPKLYKRMVKVKTPVRKKLGKYLPSEMVRKIVLNIHDEKYRDIALLQFATGARAREIITLREENIDTDDLDDHPVIRLRLEGKGGKERPTFLQTDYDPILRKYMVGKAGYLFLPDHARHADETGFERIVNTERTYLYKQLRESATELGHSSFGTHDFRRNVVEILKKKNIHIRTIQKLLGHSDMRTTMRYFDESPEDVQEAIVSHQENVKDQAR